MDSWSSLSMRQRADVIKLAVENGIHDLDTIRSAYNEFAEGGKKESWTMKDEADYRAWRSSLPANLRDTNDNDYDMRGAFKAGMQPTLESDGYYHLQSRDPRTGRILKSPHHPTYLQAINTDARLGYYPVVDRDGNTYTQTWEGNRYSDGGSIRIKPSHRGRFTRLKERTGHSASWFKAHGTPAQKKMATFELNARKWKHGLGGNLYPDGGYLHSAVQMLENNEWKPLSVGEITAQHRNRTRGKAYPNRVRGNNSFTKQGSEKIENDMNIYLTRSQRKRGSSNAEYDIPFVEDKGIVINGHLTSTNVLDSLAKYAGIHNRNPKISQKPIFKRDSYGSPRAVNRNEMLGLSTLETQNGAIPFYNYKEGNPTYNKALGNSNYLVAFDYIPAENLVRDFHYNDAGVDRNTPPLLDAFRYYAQGDYNRGNKSHTEAVNSVGASVWKNPEVQKWWELSGKYWYNNGKGKDE